MIFNELRKHGRLAARRNPMYERNQFAKVLGYVMVAFWASYLIIFGTTFAFTFGNVIPNREPYQVMNEVGLLCILALDFLMRFPLQKTPTQEVKPYLLLPMKRKRIIDFLLIRSGLDLYNYLWLFFFIPFALISITKFFGIAGVLLYLIGVWLLIVANNYWFLLCRTLINEHAVWVLLPLAVYGGTACLLFLPGSPFASFFMDLGNGYIEGNPLCFLGTLAIIFLLCVVNHRLMSGLIYTELSRTEDNRTKHVSEYRLFDRYGETGEYMKLELKMILRNRRCKSMLRRTLLLIACFSCVLGFSSIYDGRFMNSFIAAYNFSAIGIIMLSSLMSFEGNYLDGLLARKGSISSLLKAKYCLYFLIEIIPFLLMIPAIVNGKFSLLGAFSWFFYATGFVYFCYFQLAVYNKQTLPLNENLASRQGNTALLTIVSLVALGLPSLVYSILGTLVGETPAHLILLLIGLGFTLSSPLWLRNVCRRFWARRYDNLEGFRESRQGTS